MSEAPETASIEFVTDLYAYDPNADCGEIAKDIRRIMDWDGDTEVFSYDSPGSGVVHIGVEDETEANALAVVLKQHEYLIYAIRRDYHRFLVFFGLPAPTDAWDRGDLFRFEHFRDAGDRVVSEARQYAFERNISALMREGWVVQSVTTDHSDYTITLINVPLRNALRS